MRKPLSVVVLLVSSWLVVGLGGCGGAAPAAGKTGSGAASQAVGASGGTVSTGDGASLVFPAGALPTSTTITMTATPGAPVPAHATAVGTPYVFGPEGQQFAVPVTLTLPLVIASLPAGKSAKDIVIFTAPVGSTAFTPLATSLVDATHASARTMHFSVFVPVVLDDGVDAGPAGCTTDADCAAGEACLRNTCVATVDAGDAGATCATDSDCPAGEACVNQACEAVAADAGVDAEIDAAGCTVDSDCARGEACVNQQCVLVSTSDAGTDDAADADDADAACAAGEVLCGAVCTDVTSDPGNCGQCGAVCPSGSTCMRGVCGP